MSGYRVAFFRFVAYVIVRHDKAGKAYEKKVRGARAIGEMLTQICIDYSTLPDVRTLEVHEIKFFYEGLRGSLMR